jgi:transcriptional repressor NrdR
MKCPFCHEGDFAVIDSRSRAGGFPVRRRRSCAQCKRKAWTIEEIVDAPLQVIKKDESREPFDPDKMRRGLEKACYKRPVRAEQIEQIVDHVRNDVYARYFGEVPATVLGDLVMERLKELDQVAYVRFASVYREFKDASDFVHELQPMLRQTPNGARKKKR